MHRPVLLLISAMFSGWATSASIAYKYDPSGQTAGINGIVGISQESSWRCRGDTSLLCACPSSAFVGTIESVEYRKGDAIAEAIVVRTDIGAEYVVLGKEWDSELGTADASWVPTLLRRGEPVLVIAERCGASGRTLVARDIFSRRAIGGLRIDRNR